MGRRGTGRGAFGLMEEILKSAVDRSVDRWMDRDGLRQSSPPSSNPRTRLW